MARHPDHPRDRPGNFWDQRYGGGDMVFGHEPNQWLQANTDLLKPGLDALMLGDGEGRNGVWLAKRGLNVTNVDAFLVGVEKATQLAASRGVSINAENAYLRDWVVPVGAFDLVMLAFLHVRPDDCTELHHRIASTLKHGGLLLLEGFTPDHLGYGKGGCRSRTRC
ncbi:MAG: class I SAM-dependent methyltransferase [Alphaproteobacteria bacterium]